MDQGEFQWRWNHTPSSCLRHISPPSAVDMPQTMITTHCPSTPHVRHIVPRLVSQVDMFEGLYKLGEKEEGTK